LRYGAVRANVHEICRNVRMPTEEGFDLAQGRHTRGSGWAMLVQERMLCGEDLFQLPLVIDVPHAFLPAAVRDGGVGPIPTSVSTISSQVFQRAGCAQPYARTLTTLSQRPTTDAGRPYGCHPHPGLGPLLNSMRPKFSW
jgi:hypothetical protein